MTRLQSMYLVLLRNGDFEVTSFGVMVALAAPVGLWLFRRELRRSGLRLDATDAGLVGVIGGLVGAKLLWRVEHAPRRRFWDCCYRAAA